MRTQTAPYKYPRKVEFVTELPKTMNGKWLLKDKLHFMSIVCMPQSSQEILIFSCVRNFVGKIIRRELRAAV